MRKTELLDFQFMKKSIIRISHEIIERNNKLENLYLIGILTRGKPLAERIQHHIYQTSNYKVQIGNVDITFHRDDYSERLLVPQLNGNNIHESVDDKTIILVDDVLFTGRTVRAAMDSVTSFGRPKVIQLAVLIDRGHRELPIKADFVGKNIPTHEGEHVEVLLNEIDKKDSICLLQKGFNS